MMQQRSTVLELETSYSSPTRRPAGKARTARLRGSGAGRQGPRKRPSRGVGRSPRSVRDERGYSLAEMLVSTAIMMIVTGAIFGLINPAQGVFETQPEVSDQQQRMRVGADMLYKDLLMAGAGTYSGPKLGSLINYFAPVLPYRTGAQNADPPQSFRPDAISLMHVPQTASQTTISDPMPQPSAELKVHGQPGCPMKGPDKDPLCGFKQGQTVLIFDDTGANDTFTITQVQSEAMHLQKRGQTLSKAYDSGAVIAQVETNMYYFDPENRQLRHYNGLTTDVPVVDNVVGVQFQYFGDPNPPLAPKPATIGVENCLFDAAHNPKLPVLPSTSGSLVELTPELLTTGPTCGAGVNAFDADLYRVRKVRVTLRVQVASAQLRGADPALFQNPGLQRHSARVVPDYEMSFEVTPRNMNLTR